MRPQTATLWAKQDQHRGDRRRLFTAVGRHVDPARVLYPGCFVDIAPSILFPAVIYVDIDRRAVKFFADEEGVREILRSHEGAMPEPEFRFIHADYTTDVGLTDETFDLLVSLYAGFVSEACGRYLRVGGTLLANPSHGDVAMASIDPRFELAGVVHSSKGDYRVSAANLDTYLIPRTPQDITVEGLHRSGRAISYTKPAFAYLFRRVS